METGFDLYARRLSRAVEKSYESLDWARNLTHGLVEEYTGSGYGPGGRPRQEILVNLMNQAVDAYTMSLVANRPRVMFTAKQEHLAGFAKTAAVAVNNYIAEINLEYTLRQWVLDAFFCCGFIKVHMADSGPVQLEKDIWMDPGKPFASNVSIDNWVHDYSATKRSEVKFEGDAYRMVFEDLKADFYDQSAVSQLTPTSKYAGTTGDARLENIGRGYEVDPDEFEPMIDLIDLWVPRDSKVYTFALDATNFTLRGKPVAVMDWDGPENGPYHTLGFSDVPENIMPTSEAAHLAGLSRLTNNLLRKQARRAKSQKRMHTFTEAGAGDAKRLKNGSDDEWIKVNDPKEIGQVDVGGADPNTQALILGIMSMFDRMAGNLTAMLGLGAQAGTVGQEELIHGAVSKKEAQMQYRVVDGARRIIRDLAYMIWNDPIRTIPGRMPIDGTTLTVDATWTPGDREGTFFDYDLEIDVYSMPYQSPQQRANAIMQRMTQLYLPAMPHIIASGGTINFQKLLEIDAELTSEPRFKEIIQFAQVLQPQQGAEEMPTPTSTTRTNIRKNVPTQGTMQGQRHVEAQNWLNAAASGGLTNPGAR